VNESPTQETAAAEPERQRRGFASTISSLPWITYSVIVLCGAIFAYLNLADRTPYFKPVTRMLIPSATRIWTGWYWGLLTTAFIHVDAFHVLFNMWWTKDFGRVLEPTMGRWRYILFIATAAIVSSGAQLAISGQTGIGFSGVVYAMFGYALAARNVEPRYRQIINAQTIKWLLGWLVVCIALTVAEIWKLGNGAHVGGFLFGYCVGNLFVARKWLTASRVVLTLLTCLTLTSVAYMPWSPTWRARAVNLALVNLANAAADGREEAQYLYGLLLTRQAGKKTEGTSWLKFSAEKGYVPAMNALAWSLATDKDPRSRNGAEAVRWAEAACQKDNWNTPAYLDTRAAAYAELDRWEDAVATQKMALSKSIGGDTNLIATIELHLQQYLRKEKARE